MKREDENISDAVERLINKKKEANLVDFFGVLKDSKVLRGLEEDTKKIRFECSGEVKRNNGKAFEFGESS